MIRPSVHAMPGLSRQCFILLPYCNFLRPSWPVTDDGLNWWLRDVDGNNLALRCSDHELDRLGRLTWSKRDVE